MAPFLKRTMPGTLSLASELGAGAASAILGPFAPIAGMVGTLAKGALGVGAGIHERRQLAKEENLTRQLAPMSGALRSSTFNQLSTRRGQQPDLSYFGGVSGRRAQQSKGSSQIHKPSKEELVFPLSYFFDKTAFKSKWTKELFEKFTRIERKLGGGSGDSGGGMLGMLGGAMVPLIPTIIAFSAGIVAATTSIYTIVKAAQAFTDWWKSTKYKEEAKKVSVSAATMKKGEIIDKIGLQQYSKKSGRNATDVSRELLHGGLSEKEYRANLKKEMQLAIPNKAGSWAPMGSAPVSKNELEVEYQKRLTSMVSKADTNRTDEKLPVGNRSVFPGLGQKQTSPDDSVVKAVEKLTEVVSRQQSSGVRGAALGDPFGAGDPVLLPWSSGKLSMGDD
ncbi:MAG: hypothetical protein IMZ47_02255, partial [Firmicutes bacterium]|nr:hypothetical protein [Bacillota bacterium]